MELEPVKFIFFFLLGTSVLNFSIALLLRFKTRHKEFNDLIIYWPCIILTFVSAAILGDSPQEIGVAYFFQFFSSNLIVKMMCNSQKIKIRWPVYISIQALAMICATYMLYYTKVDFTYAMLPVSASFSLPFIRPIWYSLVENRKESNYIEKAMGLVFLTGIVNHFNYAFFRLDPNAAFWGWSVSIAQYQCLSLFLPLLINHRRELNEISFLNNAIEKISGTRTNEKLRLDSLYENLDSLISQKEKLYRLLQDANSNLEEERETNEILIRTISHDLANPLTVISAYIEMLRCNKFNKDEAEVVWERVKLNISSALTMMQKIRAAILNRTQATLVDIKPTSPDTCISLLNEIFETKLAEKNITLTIENELTPKTFVMADKDGLINHVLANILSNAIKFSYTNGVISVSLSEEKNDVTINIRDYGVGIKQKQMGSPIYSSTKGTSGEEGTGFGLMVSGYFIRKFNAELSLTTPPGSSGTLASLKLKKANITNSLPNISGETRSI